MNAQTSPAAARQIYWPSVITVISAAILIGAEVFGAAFAGGWALAILFGLDDFGAHILQAVLFAIGVFIMTAFIRAAHPNRHTTPTWRCAAQQLRIHSRREHKISAWEEADLKLAEEPRCPVALRKLSRLPPAESC